MRAKEQTEYALEREELLWPKASFRPDLTGRATDGRQTTRREVQFFTDRTDHLSKKTGNLTR